MNRLKNIWTVFKKEFLSFFNSPVAYIVITVFLLFSGWLFFQQFFLIGQAGMRPLFALIPILFIFFAPAITMRLVAEERKTKTISLLLTLPLGNAEIILGKFLAAEALLGVALLLTLPYAFTVSSIGMLDWGPVWGGYLGALLMGAAYLAVGLFCSSLTSNQIVAFILGLGICFFFFIIDKVLIFLPGNLSTVFEYFSVDYHFRNIARGVIDLRDIVFYISFVAAFMIYSIYAVQREDWR
ncbi:MAG TPA: ABC transporter permease subunit [Syntrophobacteraceae bacterium]|nr:ABC transporter permease subunit [Syntrophobacteraceae bacterium]